MPGRLGAQRGSDPLRHRPKFVAVVVEAGDQQRRQLDPHAAAAHLHDRVADRLPARPADMTVEVVVGRLEVDVGRVEVRNEQVQGLMALVAVGDEDVAQAGGTRPGHRVQGVLKEDRRLGVRVGDASSASRDGLLHHPLRRQVATLGHAPLSMGLRDVPVLAVGAVEVAALGRHRERLAAGQEVVQRLLLDRLGLRRHGLAVDERVQQAATVLADAAQADTARTQDAPMGARDAADAAGGDGVVEGLAQEGKPDARLRRVGWSEVVDPKARRRLLTGHGGANRPMWPGVGIEWDGRRFGERLASVRRRDVVVHQGPQSAASPRLVNRAFRYCPTRFAVCLVGADAMGRVGPHGPRRADGAARPRTGRSHLWLRPTGRSVLAQADRSFGPCLGTSRAGG